MLELSLKLNNILMILLAIVSAVHAVKEILLETGPSCFLYKTWSNSGIFACNSQRDNNLVVDSKSHLEGILLQWQ